MLSVVISSARRRCEVDTFTAFAIAITYLSDSIIKPIFTIENRKMYASVKKVVDNRKLYDMIGHRGSQT